MVCMAPQVYWLTNWSFHSDRQGRLYVVGDLPDGRLWETSTVYSVQSTDTQYIAYTANSVYILHW